MTVAPTREEADQRYTVYLIVVAVAGWALASFDSNLLTLTMPSIADDFRISSSTLGVLTFIVFAAEFVLALFVGWAMDRRGRRWVWMFCLAMAAVFTGLTYFVGAFWQLVLVRALASGFANAELAVSITLVNEQVPGRRRGFLYSIVQGGWPIGVFLASGIYLLTTHLGLGWRDTYLFGVIPLIVVAIGRMKVRESDRYTHLRAVRDAVAAGNSDEVARLQAERPMKADEVDEGSVRQLVSTPGPVRTTFVRLTVTWLLYAISFVATNVYITYWLTHAKGWTAGAAATLLLVCGGIGFFFYLLGGVLGERFGRKRVLVASGVLVAPLNLILLLLHNHVAVAVFFFLVYQATNGTWSGAGYAYQAESFPTRVRAPAVGWLGAMMVGGQAIGSLVWVGLSDSSLTVTWIVLGIVVALGQGVSTFLLPDVAPGQELEEILT